MVSPGIEEPDKVRGQEHISSCFAPNRRILTGFLAECLFHQRKIDKAGGIAGWLKRPLIALRRHEEYQDEN